MTPPATETPGTRSAIGLALAGGGVGGALYEFGALLALDAALEGWSPVRSDPIVGTSAGAVVGAVLALGVDPGEIRRALEPGVSHPLAFTGKDFRRTPWGEYLRWGLRGRIPPGAFSNAGLEAFVHRAARVQSRGESFADLLAPLSIPATDLDTGERVVFGSGGDASVPVGTAVRASAAIPGFFEPVSVGERTLIDGQILDPLHLDLAAGPGTRVVLAISTLIPYRADRNGRVLGAGAAAIMEQSARIAAAVKLEGSMHRLTVRRPDLHILSFEPDPATILALYRTRFHRASLLAAWELGYTSTFRTLEDQHSTLEPVLETVGVRMNLDALRATADRWAVRPKA